MAAPFRVGTPTIDPSSSNRTSVSFSHTTTSDTDLLVVAFIIEGDEVVDIDPQFNGADLTSIRGTSGSGDNNNIRVLLYGMVSPGAVTANITITFDTAVNPSVVICRNWANVDATSVATATNLISDVANFTATATSVLTSGGSSGNTLYAVGGFQGNDGGPVGWTSSAFDEIIEGTTGTSSFSDFTYADAEYFTLPAGTTIGWSATDQNAAILIELVSGGGGTTYFETLTTTALGSAALGSITTWFRALAATALGSASLGTLTTWFRTLAATAVASATLTIITIYVKLLGATAVGAAALSTLATFQRTLVATATGTATLARKTGKFLDATALGTATLLRKTSKTLAAVVVAPASLTAATLYTRTLAATALATATLGAIVTFGQTLTATALGVASLSTLTTWFRTLAATTAGVATLAKSISITLAATTVGTATLLKKTSKTLGAQATGVAGLIAAGLYEQALAAVALGVATLNTAYTAAGPVIASKWRWLAMRLGI